MRLLRLYRVIFFIMFTCYFIIGLFPNITIAIIVYIITGDDGYFYDANFGIIEKFDFWFNESIDKLEKIENLTAGFYCAVEQECIIKLSVEGEKQ